MRTIAEIGTMEHTSGVLALFRLWGLRVSHRVRENKTIWYEAAESQLMADTKSNAQVA